MLAWCFRYEQCFGVLFWGICWNCLQEVHLWFKLSRDDKYVRDQKMLPLNSSLKLTFQICSHTIWRKYAEILEHGFWCQNQKCVYLYVCLHWCLQGMHLETERKQWEISYWCTQHKIEEVCCSDIKGTVERHRCFFVCFCHFTHGDSEIRQMISPLCLEILFSFQYYSKMFKWK